MNYRKLITGAMAALMAISASVPCSAEDSMKTLLTAKLIENAEAMVDNEDEELNIYSNIKGANRSDALPAKFDLRDRDVVPAIRSQENFGTCWGFASIGACEISLLSDLGITAQEYLELTGTEMNLSERHLAWFASVPIAETEGMTEHDLAQVGEGRGIMNDDGTAGAHFNIGGTMQNASGMFASGIGPVSEEVVPYRANDGSSSTAKDWSVDESLRFNYEWELKDSSILPTPAGRDAEGRYVYNPIATEMIKQELLAGRGVTIAYHADQAMDPEAETRTVADLLTEMGAPEKDIEMFLSFQGDEDAAEELPMEDQITMFRISVMLLTGKNYDETPSDMLGLMVALLNSDSEAMNALMNEADGSNGIYMNPEQESAAREAAAKLGFDFDAFIAETERQINLDSQVYINTDTYAQYTWDENASMSHAVVIVGYDDNYPASNFLPDHQPPADGAWIVRNSWGAAYGIDGYFYLSYYDRTLTAPETFEFVTDIDSLIASELEIQEYDFMQTGGINSVSDTAPIYTANEFTVQTDSVLTYVSTLTANLDTSVTTAVYLLNDNAQSPVDGELLDILTTKHRYAGYHRIPLNHHYSLPAGTKVSVVQTQRYVQDGELRYALPYTTALNHDYCELYNVMVNQNWDLSKRSYTEGRIGRGESFIGLNGEWTDWLDFTDGVKAGADRVGKFVSFDNLSMKLYLYKMADIEILHTFSDSIPYAGSTVKVCGDCGYTLIES